MGLMYLWCAAVAAAEMNPIVLPAGETRLLDIGTCRVGYVYTDGRAGVMPAGWMGHFHGPTGISYTPFGQQDGKECLLIHCPWHAGTGITYVEYSLKLPETHPIRLELAIAMKADVARPDRSDGCQFRATVKPAEGTAQTLVNEHYALAKWKPFAMDLSPYAGKPITLRLEVGAGPRNNPGWDYAFFGDPKIVVGEGQAAPPPAPIWPATADLKRLSNRRDVDCCPSGPTAGPARMNWDETTGLARFDIDWPAEKARISYTIRTGRDGENAATELIDVTAMVVGVEGKPVGSYRIGASSGVVLTDGKNRWEPDSPAVKVRLVSVTKTADHLRVETEHAAGGVAARVATEFSIRGSSLVTALQTKDPVISEVRFGAIAAPLRRTMTVPYMGLGPICYLPDSQLFGSIVLDWTRSQASRHDASTAHYTVKTDGTFNAVATTAYYTLAPRMGEVFCNIPHPPSPFMTDLAGRVMFDIWGGKFRGDAQWFIELATYDVRDAAIIKHDWQRSGYDNALPNHYPANPNLGGDKDMAFYVETTRGLGYRTSLHENYVDFYPNSELYDPNDLALEPDGQPTKAWFNGGTGIQSFAAKPTAIMKYARMQSPEIHRRYGTNAAYLDVHTCVPPWFHVDSRAGEPGAGTFAAVYKAHSELFAFERQTHEGPLFGEGNLHFFWAGLCDGTEAQVDGGENAAWLLDFDLLKVHPQMVNHGMGYLERWLVSGYGTGWYSNVPTTMNLDKYRAMELAFGHAGFVANQIWRQLPFVLREYYLVTPVQQRYVDAKPTAILYDVNGRMQPASVALAAGPLSNRIHVEYDSGLKLWCNGSDRDWNSPSGLLCPYGFRAQADALLVSTSYWPTADGGKQIADYREADDIIYADARAFEPCAPVSMADVAPGLRECLASGPRKLKMTYQWVVREDQTKDRHCYVHFVSPAAGTPERIAFQNDHPLPKPMSQWKAGETVTDGPHEVTIPAGVPDDTYQVLIGLFDASGRATLPFESDGSLRYGIGTVTVQGDQVSFAKIDPVPYPTDDWRRQIARHTNPKRTIVDFGKVATNGCVIIQPMHKSWQVTVYPREQAFKIRLRMSRLDPKAGPTGWNVQKINVNKRSFGPVPLTVEGDQIEWETGQPGMFYYCVSR